MEGRGLSPAAAARSSALLSRCAGTLCRSGVETDSPAWAFFVPGRVEVVGKHTDYCGGRSLLAATEQGFTFVATRARDSTIEVTDALSGEHAAFCLDPDLTPRAGHWSNYPMTVARRVARNFQEARCGLRLAFASNLPPAAGMSTSSALVVGSFLVLSKVNGLEELDEYQANIQDAHALASYLATVENGASFGGLCGDRGVGTQGGSEDHTAILCCAPEKLSLYSFGPVRLERQVGLPPELVLAIASSGVVAEKTGSAMELYNRASRRARAVVEAWNANSGAEEPHLAAVLASGPRTLERLKEVLARGEHSTVGSEELLHRLEHFVEESEAIIPRAASCLERGELHEFGELVDRSQESGVRLLGNQVPETIFLAREARKRGALAASAFGAGFGGSVWALIRRVDGDAFLDSWRRAYLEAFPRAGPQSSFFTTKASHGVFELFGKSSDL
jgi:galactokinase